MTTNDFERELAGTDFADYQDDDRRGDGLIRMLNRNGDPKAGSNGYFFIGADNLPEGFKPDTDNWKPHREFFEGTNKRVDGWKAEQITCFIITARTQSFYRDSLDNKIWCESWPKDQERAGQHVDVLMVVEGLNDLGPIVWATNSTKAAFAIIGRGDAKKGFGDGILETFKKLVLTPAGKLTGKDLTKRPWCFAATIGFEVDGKGEPVYTQTPGRMVTLPVLILPKIIDKAYLTGIYAGIELVRYGEMMRGEYDAWRAEKRTNETRQQPQRQQPADAPADDRQPRQQPRQQPRNVPQPIEDDTDLPF